MSDQEPGKSEPVHEKQKSVRPGHPSKRAFKLALIALIALILSAGLVLAGVLPRLARQKKITASSQAVIDSIPSVSVIQAGQASASSNLQLPGDVEAIQVATISAQTTGYLRKFHAD